MLNVFDGQITQTDGLRDALEGILSAKSVQNGVLRIQSDLVSGRVGIFCARFITGAQVDSTGESGGLALRRLLSARSGSFSFEDARGSDISDLKQSLSIDVEILLENITELLAGKSVTLSDGSMFGFAMPVNRIKKPSGEDAPPTHSSPAPVTAAAPAQPAAPSTPSGLSAQWKLLAGARDAQPPAPGDSNGEAPKEAGTVETGDFQAVTPAAATEAASQMNAAPAPAPAPATPAAPKPTLGEEIAPSENTFEYGTLGTDERQALEITGEFGTYGSDGHLHPKEQGDLRAQMQTSAPVKPSIPQTKPAAAAGAPAPVAPAVPPPSPAPVAAAPAPAPIAVPPPKLPPAASAATPPDSIPSPDLSTPAPLATDFASAAAASAAAPTPAPAPPPALHAQAFGAPVDLSLPTGGPQAGLIKPAKNELEDFVSEMQAFNNNRAEADAKPISGSPAQGSNELDSFVNELRSHSSKPPAGAAKSELDDFMSEMQGASAAPASGGPVGLIKPAKNELEDFAAELRAASQQPQQPALNPFNDEEIVPESGSFGIGDLFATKPAKKEPEPPPPAPVQKNSGTEYTMADLFSSKGGSAGAKPAAPAANEFANPTPAPLAAPTPTPLAAPTPTPLAAPTPAPAPAPPKPTLGALPPAAVQNSQPAASSPAASAFAAEAAKFSDAFSEKSSAMGDEIVGKAPSMADAFAANSPASSAADAFNASSDAFNAPSPRLGNESIRPSASLGSPPASILDEPSLGSDNSGAGAADSERPSAFGSPENNRAANTLPPVRNTNSMPLTGAAAGLPSQRQDKTTGAVSGLPSQTSKPTSDYQLPSQKGTTQNQKGSGQTMKSALNSLPSMNRDDMDVQPAKPDPDWPDDFPNPERMRRTSDVVKPSQEQPRQPEAVPSWDDPAFDPEELMKRRRERRGGLQEPDGDPFDRIAASRASEAAQSGGKLRAIVEEGAAQSAFAPIAHPNAMVKPAVQHGPKPGFRKLNQWNTSGMFAVKIVAVLLVLGAGAAFWHFYGEVVVTAFQKMFAPPPPPPPEKPPVVTKPKTDTPSKKKPKRRRRRH